MTALPDPPPVPCPLTGEATVKVQRLTRRFLHALWHHSHRLVPTPLARHGPAIELRRSPCGLMFFHPPVAGDAAFYRAYYAKLDGVAVLSDPAHRPEFVEAARHAAPGDRVLDVGCGAVGQGRGLAALLPPGAAWTGLDPYLAREVHGILRETLEDHAAANPAAYDVVCAFQVLEHVERPRAFAETMASLLRPGGRLILGVPLCPSPLTEIPNLALNAPPHHLSWWTVPALRALATVLGLEVLRAEPLPPPRHAASLFWLHRTLLRRAAGDTYFAHRWSWWLSLLAGGAVAAAALRLGTTRLPRGARPIDAFLVARKPGPGDGPPHGTSSD